ncbi:hypothetical protein RZS28_09285 [Methylocapsa polymorpha]|uniref:MOSC domain-containing protein n=1 Tax=Methylocapsa polymorpha TaxID=3080828 RepID=A0ABZ0HNY4_9HYPH|nr:hypothetical protein RZS28_09285 [Methylocapsa sp. RX1]
MKLRVPNGCGAVSHNGKLLEIAEDGSIHVDDDDWVFLSSHGFRPWKDEHAGLEIAAMTREGLVMRVMSTNLKTLQGIGTEDMRARLPAADDGAGPSEVEKVTTSQASSNIDGKAISAFNRHELFAFLRAKGVSVSLPITNDELRAMARRSLD